MGRFIRQISIWRVHATRSLERLGINEDRLLILLSILVGGATGLGAHLFYELLEFAYDHASAEGGFFALGTYMLILLPVLGAILVGIITTTFASEAKGHGVPEVMDALCRKGGEIRPRVAFAKAISSALTISSGGSAGTEGPIVQIGAAIGSSVGQVLGIKRHQMNTLVACGVAGGIAAIFNAPIAGVLFALEIFLRDFSFRTFSPIVFASVISTSLTHALRPDEGGIFEVVNPELYTFRGAELPYYLVLGVFCAIASVAFIRVLYFAEDVTDKIKIPNAFKPAIGGALLGLTGIVYVYFQHPDLVPEFYSNGYPLIRKAIGPDLLSVGLWTLAGLGILKALATTFTLGTGGSGGIFAPSLFMGACLGGAFGIAMHKLGLVEETSASAYAIVGMAALVAGTTHAPLTAIVMLYELTRQPRVILPIMFAAIVTTSMAQYMLRESIYTLKLVRRGIRIGRVADTTILRRLHADSVPTVPAPLVKPDAPLQQLLRMAEEYQSPDFVVVDDDGKYLGIVVADDIKTALLQPEAVPLLVVAELSRPPVPCISATDTLDSVLDKFARLRVNALPVTGQDDVIRSMITRHAVMDVYQQALDEQG
ncbi:MAG: chloride channel protein [Phycisphaerae bacterium]|nr:MAG: chloride channel protein [Phycisphaerae bacterium]